MGGGALPLVAQAQEACCAAGCPCCWRAHACPAGNASASVVSPSTSSADVLVTHPEQPTEGVILLLRDHFVAEGRLIPPEEGMCRWEARHTSVTVPCFESQNLLEGQGPGNECVARHSLSSENRSRHGMQPRMWVRHAA